jgi:DNA-binding NarL/FixJ family response regulator
MDKIKLLIVDDHLLVRSGIISLLSDEEDIEISGEAASGEEALKKVESIKPDVVLMDISMSGMSGLQAAELIKNHSPAVKVIILTMHEEKEYLYNALKIKVDGILNKSAGKTELSEAVRSASKGERYFGRSVSEILADHFIEDTHTKGKTLLLTKREKEILLCIAENLTTSEIAEKLSVSPRTIDTHRSNLIQKYHLKSAQGLYKFALDYVANSDKIKPSAT